MKRFDKPSLTDISPIHHNSLQYKNNYDFNYASEYATNQQHYADDFMNQQVQVQDEVNELSLIDRLIHNRKCFNQFTEMIGGLKETPLDLQEIIIPKQCPSNFPLFQELVKIYEKDIQKMQITKTLKKNWNEDDIIILIWCVVKYCTHQNLESHKSLSEADWQFIANMIPGKDKQSCRFKWLKMCKVNIQDEPWTKEENELLPIIANSVQQIEKGKKDWVEVSSRLFYETQQKIYRTPKQCREHFNNYHDPEIKKGSWSQEEDLELLKYAQEMGKKWSVIAKKLKGRTENAVKNRFHAIFRKHAEQRSGNGALGESGDEGSPKFYESEEFSSEHNVQSVQNEAGLKQLPLTSVVGDTTNTSLQTNELNLLSNEAKNEKKLINKLIRNIENKLKINSSGYCSSDNNSVYSDSSRNSKVLKKQKEKHQKFILKNQESMSSDDDTSKYSPSPRAVGTTQKSIFGKAHADSVKCKEDEDAELEDTGYQEQQQVSTQGYMGQFTSGNYGGQQDLAGSNSRQAGKKIESVSSNLTSHVQKQHYSTNGGQFQIPTNSYAEDKYRHYPYSNQQQSNQVQQQSNQTNVASNPQIGSQNFDFFNSQIVLGTGTNNLAQSGLANAATNNSVKDVGVSMEEFGNNSYADIQGHPQTGQQQSSGIHGFSAHPKIPSLDHIEMKPDEMKLKVMNYAEFTYDPSDQLTYAIVNISKNEIYLVPASQNSSFTKLIPLKQQQSSHSNSPIKNQSQHETRFEQQRFGISSEQSVQSNVSTKPEIKQQVGNTGQYYMNQQQNIQKNFIQPSDTSNCVFQNGQQNAQQNQQIGQSQLVSSQVNPQLTQNRHQQMLIGNQNQYIDTYNPANQSQHVTQGQQSYQSQTNPAQHSHAQMMGIQQFSNPASFSVIGNIAPQLAPMKIEDNHFFLLQSNGFNMQGGHHPAQFLPYPSTTPQETACYNQQQNLSYSYAGTPHMQSAQHQQQQSTQAQFIQQQVQHKPQLPIQMSAINTLPRQP